jgi:hypothetical protein
MNIATVNTLTDTISTLSTGDIPIDCNSYPTTISSFAGPLFTMDQFMSTHFPNLTLDQLKHIVSLHPEASL